VQEFKRPTGGANNTKASAMFEGCIDYSPAGDTIGSLGPPTGMIL
jgi:hypothetical protein